MTSRGFTLMECLVALCVASIAALILSSALRFAGGTFQHASKAIYDRNASAALRAALENGIRALDRSRLAFSVSVWPSPRLMAYGSPHPLYSLSGVSAPRAESDIASFIDLSPLYAGTIIRSTVIGLNVTCYACGFAARPTSSQFRSYVALGVSGAVQLTGSARASGSGCLEFAGQAVPGLVSDPATILPTSLLRLVPVEREYSLFVDASGQLRFASHTSSRILENQPLLSGLRRMRLTPLVTPWGTTGYRASIEGAYGLRSESIIPIGLLPRTVLSQVL